jgi:SAM-dependent methyltransferase
MNAAPAPTVSHGDSCRVCGAPLEVEFADLGMIPLCQSYISREDLCRSETFYPLRATLCMRCYYVGLPEYVGAHEIFSEYAYFSSTSTSWVHYIEKSAKELIAELGLDASTQVVEMASNDGYMLRNFVARGIPCVGVEPAANVAQVANERGVPTLPLFFNSATAQLLRERGESADLFLAYNSLDHVPNLNDVVEAMKSVLKPTGVIQVEVPYLASMIEHGEFDTMYHDRFSYFSLLCLDFVFAQHGLRIVDACKIPTHGGSLRVRACHADNGARPTKDSVAKLLQTERATGLTTRKYYDDFADKKRDAKFALLDLLIRLRREGHSIVGYGVPAKGNVLLNYCGIRGDMLDYLVDRSPYKCGKFAPGSRLEIRDIEQVRITKPDYLVILPWNIKDEILEQMSFIRDWGGRFIIPIPRVEVL